MILINNKSFEEIVEQTTEALEKESISTTPGSIAKLFADIINSNIAGFYKTLSLNHVQAFLTTATGDFLEAIGYLLSCERLELETDYDYRRRIHQQTLVLAKANETSIRLAVLSCDGIDDVVLKRYSYGPGSMTIIPVTSSKSDYEKKITEVKKVINDVVSFGEKVVVRPPTNKYVKLSLSLIFAMEVNDIDRQGIVLNVKDEVTKYINSLRVGEAIIINELVQRIMQVDDKILNFSCNSFKVNNRECLFINQGARWDEKFVVSPDEGSIYTI